MDVGDIGARLRALRLREGLTLEALSSASGIPPESISRIERGRSAASLRTLVRLAGGLGVPLVRLFEEAAVVSTVDAADIPAEVRGIAVLLAGQSPRMLIRARKILEALVEE